MRHVRGLDVRSETTVLRDSFDSLLNSHSPRLKETSEQLPPRLLVRGSDHWVNEFSPTTLLYPLLQAEGFSEVSVADARRATLAHLCLIISVFIEDRALDGQIRLTSAEQDLAKSLASEGLKTLRRLRRHVSGEVRPETVLDSMARTDLQQDAVSLDEFSLRLFAARRAGLGFLATSLLLQYSGVEPKRLTAARTAFDCLAIGLQYADDLEDWREDLRLRDENLLLVRLRDKGLDPYLLPANEHRIPNVGHALLRHHSIEQAIDRSLEYFARAEEVQRGLRCFSLLDRLQDSSLKLKASVARLNGRIEQEVIVASLIAPLVKT